MAKLHPQTPVIVRATFMNGDQPGAFVAGTAKHTSLAGTNTLIDGSQVDDPAGGKSEARWDGSANANGSSSDFQVAADGDAGPDDDEVSGTAHVDWDTGQQILATGVVVDAVQAA